MVLQLPTRTPVEFESNLVHFIHTEFQRHPSPIPFLDCRSTLTRALLARPDLKNMVEQLSIVRVETADELTFMLKSVDLHRRLKESKVFVISPFYHLLSELSAFKQKRVLHVLEEQFERLERKFGIHLVIAEEG